MSKSRFNSPLLNAKVVKSMIQVPNFLQIVETYEELYNLKKKCIDFSSRPRDMRTIEEEETIMLLDKLKRNKYIIKQYIEQEIDSAKHSNGNWAALNTLSSEQRALETKAKKELSKIDKTFKSNLDMLEKLQKLDKDTLSIEDKANIAAITILLIPSIKKYVASNPNKAVQAA